MEGGREGDKEPNNIGRRGSEGGREGGKEPFPFPVGVAGVGDGWMVTAGVGSV